MKKKSIIRGLTYIILAAWIGALAGPSVANDGSKNQLSEEGNASSASNSRLSPATSAVGFWFTEQRDGIVQLYLCNTELCGRMHWLKDDGPSNVSRDDKNPDPAKRNRPLCGMEFMNGFKHKDDNHYIGGTIYSPRHGANFHAEITQIDQDTLELYGYIVVPLLGKGQKWKRATDPVPACTTADSK